MTVSPTASPAALRHPVSALQPPPPAIFVESVPVRAGVVRGVGQLGVDLAGGLRRRRRAVARCRQGRRRRASCGDAVRHSPLRVPFLLLPPKLGRRQLLLVLLPPDARDLCPPNRWVFAGVRTAFQRHQAAGGGRRRLVRGPPGVRCRRLFSSACKCSHQALRCLLRADALLELPAGLGSRQVARGWPSARYPRRRVLLAGCDHPRDDNRQPTRARAAENLQAVFARPYLAVQL